MTTQVNTPMRQPGPRFLITGANGFVGTALSKRLLADGHHVVEVRRTLPSGGVGDSLTGKVDERAHVADGGSSGSESRQIVLAKADFVGLSEQWPATLTCDYAVHLAARVHVMHESSTDALAHYRETNVAGALRVAEAAWEAGVKRFVFVSSVKALGDSEPGTPNRPWRESDTPVPKDPYGQSKAEAETALRAFCDRHGMQCVVVRSPLVYGPGVRANFLQLMSVIARGIPLPLAKVRAQRSMVFVDNLVDAIVQCALQPAGAGECFHVSDGVDFSVAEIVTLLAEGMGRPARLMGLPPSLLMNLARLAGKTEQASRLLQPLRLDIGHIRKTLTWSPPVAASTGLRCTANWYRDSRDDRSRRVDVTLR